MDDSNYVQTLDENKRKRGRPETKINKWVRSNFKSLTSRQSINNRKHALGAYNIALSLGLITPEWRDIATGKRMQTKLAVISRYLGSELDTDAGKRWLIDGWQFIVSTTTEELIAWTKGKQ